MDMNDNMMLCTVFLLTITMRLFSSFSNIKMRFFSPNRKLKVDQFDFNAKCSEIAEMTDGLSGREISKLGVAWQVNQHYKQI